jgi:hypothetical protein
MSQYEISAWIDKTALKISTTNSSSNGVREPWAEIPQQSSLSWRVWNIFEGASSWDTAARRDAIIRGSPHCVLRTRREPNTSTPVRLPTHGITCRGIHHTLGCIKETEDDKHVIFTLACKTAIRLHASKKYRRSCRMSTALRTMHRQDRPTVLLPSTDEVKQLCLTN